MANTTKTRKGANNSNIVANVINSVNCTTSEQLSLKHAEQTDENGVTSYTDETLCNLHAPSLGTFENWTIRVDSKIKSYGSGKKTVYTGWIKEGEQGEQIPFSLWDITQLKKAVGCNYRRFKESNRGGWLVINEAAIETVAREKVEKLFTPALNRLFALLQEVEDERATETRRAKLLLYYEELAKKYAKKVLLTHEANKEARAKEREEQSKVTKAQKALAALSPEDIAKLIAQLQK